MKDDNVHVRTIEPMPNKMTNGHPQPPRAQRFTVRLPMRYRAMSETGWTSGTTRNISRTGLLFCGKRVFPVGTKLQLSLTLPLKAKVPLAMTVLCRGEVARIHAAKGSLPRMGARFRESRLTDHPAVAA